MRPQAGAAAAVDRDTHETTDKRSYDHRGAQSLRSISARQRRSSTALWKRRSGLHGKGPRLAFCRAPFRYA